MGSIPTVSNFFVNSTYVSNVVGSIPTASIFFNYWIVVLEVVVAFFFCIFGNGSITTPKRGSATRQVFIFGKSINKLWMVYLDILK